MTPRVSVIMAAYNAERTIAAAVRSILWQTLAEIELIVVDDCSTDGTYEVLRVLAGADPRLRVIRNAQRRERSWSRNRAIKVARAELVAVLDADDIALPRRLELQTQVLETSPDVTLLGGHAYEVGYRTGAVSSVAPAAVDHAMILARMRWCNPFLHSSVVFRRDRALDAGLYDPAMNAAEDLDLFWRMVRWGARILPHPVVLVGLDWDREQQVSRLRRMADLRVRWRGMRRQGASAIRSWPFLLPGVLRLAVPSAVDIRLRKGKRWLDRSTCPDPIWEWIRACETGERPSPGWFVRMRAGDGAVPDGSRPQ